MEPIIFLSATTSDLRDACRFVAGLLQGYGVKVRFRGNLPSRGGDLRDGLKRLIDESGLVVQLVGSRYGQDAPLEEDGAERESYTQFEARYAESVGKPIYYVLMDETYAFKPSGLESDEKQELQKAYRARLFGRGVQYGEPKNEAELENEIHRLRDPISDLKMVAEARHQQILAATERVQGAVADLKASLRIHGAADIWLEPAREGQDLDWLFYYTQICPELVGRHDDFKFLREFRDHEDGFRWTFITGSGGSGKTRLAWEFVRETLALNDTAACDEDRWYAGFVRDRDLDPSFATWDPDRNVLLVLDYASEKVGAAERILRSWLDAPGPLKRRLLLLDRTYHRDFTIAEALVPKTGGGTALRIEKYAGERDAFGGLRPRRLRTMSDSEMGDAFAASYARVRGEAALGEEVEAAELLFQKEWEQEHRHALYAVALGYLAAQGDGVAVAQLKGRDVLEYLLDRQRYVWRHLQPEPQALERNLVYAGTLARGLTDELILEREGLEGADFRLAAAMVGEAALPFPIQRCQGLFPDLLGEAYVVACLNGLAGGGGSVAGAKRTAGELLDWVIEHEPEALPGRDAFLRLLAQDFLGDEAVGWAFETRFDRLTEEVQRAALRSAFKANPELADRLAQRLRDAGREDLLREFGTGGEVRAADAVSEEALDMGLLRDDGNAEEELLAFISGVEGELRTMRDLFEAGQAREALRGLDLVAEKLSQPPTATWSNDLRFRRTRARMLIERSDVRRALGEIAGTLDALGEAKAEFEALAASQPGEPGPLQDLSISLTRVGDVRRALGDLSGAEDRYVRSLTLRERVMSMVGETPESLRNVSVSLTKVGDVRRALGDFTGAEDRYVRSLGLAERVASMVAETPESLRDVSVSLNKVGDVRLTLGDFTGAEDRYVRSLGLAERVASMAGETPESLRDVSISLDRVGDVRRALGDFSGAEDCYVRSLGFVERVASMVGETPESLRDLSISLDRVGDVRLALGDFSGAEDRYVRSLGLAEQVTSMVGETPESLRDIAIGHQHVALVRSGLGNQTARKDIRTALEIARRLAAEFPDIADCKELVATTENIARAIAAQFG